MYKFIPLLAVFFLVACEGSEDAGSNVDLSLVPVYEGPDKPAAALTNTYWKLVAIDGEPFEHTTDEREPHLRFLNDDDTVSGFTGCNSFTGRFEVRNARLEFGLIAVTQRPCMDESDLEYSYLSSLRSANRFVIEGDMLRLYRGASPLLEFEADYL